MPVPTGPSHRNDFSDDDINNPPPIPPAVSTVSNPPRTSSVLTTSSAPVQVEAPGPSSSIPQTKIPNDPRDPLGLNTLPPAGSFLPGYGYVPQMNKPPIMTARLQESAAQARPSGSAAPARPSGSAAPPIEPENIKMPARRDSVSSGKSYYYLVYLSWAF